MCLAAGVMGDKSVYLHANHGVIVTGPTVADAFHKLFRLEYAAQVGWLDTTECLKVVGSMSALTPLRYDQKSANGNVKALLLARVRPEDNVKHSVVEKFIWWKTLLPVVKCRLLLLYLGKCKPFQHQ